MHSAKVVEQAHSAMRATAHQPTVEIKGDRCYQWGNGADDSIQGRRHFGGRRRSAGQRGELRRSNGTRDCSPVQAGVPRELPRLRRSLQSRRCPAWAHVHMFVFQTGATTNPRYIINFPTKRHWRGRSRIEDVEAGLNALGKLIRERGIRSIAVPALGSGLGGLEWSVVRPRIEEALTRCDDLQAVIFEPSAPSAERIARNPQVPKMTSGRAALVGLMHSYLRGLLDPFVTLLEVHKLLYFMQAAGEPLRLKFTKAPYGPYAENLRRVLHAIEGHFILGYADGGDAPNKQLEILPGAVEDAVAVLSRSPKTRERFDRVVDLVDGFESSFGLELLSTVHWTLEHDSPKTREDLIEQVYAWNDRKKRFWPRQIGLAADVLVQKGWNCDGSKWVG